MVLVAPLFPYGNLDLLSDQQSIWLHPGISHQQFILGNDRMAVLPKVIDHLWQGVVLVNDIDSIRNANSIACPRRLSIAFSAWVATPKNHEQQSGIHDNARLLLLYDQCVAVTNSFLSANANILVHGI